MSSGRQFGLNPAPTARTIRAKGQRFDGRGEGMARRRYQQGEVFLRGKYPPKWIGRYREDVVEENGTVRRVRHSIVLGEKSELPTKRLAQRRLEFSLARINAPEYRPGRVATVAEFADRWKLEVLAQRKPSTVRASVAHLRCHILPQLGRLKLDELGRERQQGFVTMLSQKVSRKSVENIMGTLSSMITTARKWGYVGEPVKIGDLVLPDVGMKLEARFFTPEQVRHILRLSEEPFRTMFYILAMTGIRAGELLGLQVEDVDFERRLLFIRRSVNRGNVQSVKSKASQRPLPLPDALAEILKRHLRTWRENPERWLFTNSRTRPFSADKVVTFKLWPILDQLKIPRCGFHAFRHFHSTMLLELGAAPQVAQAQMRHSDPRITLEVYSHVIGESHRIAVDKVAELLDPIGPNQDCSGEWIQ
jgi:integrase